MSSTTKRQVSDESIVRVDIAGWLKESTDDEVEDPDDLDPSRGEDWVDMYKLQDVGGGSVKSYKTGDESTSLVISKEKADYSVAVERLVWLDGYRYTTDNQAATQQQDAMTLAVLKIRFSGKIKSAAAELRFLPGSKYEKGPEVVAWGPFCHTETWNTTNANIRINNKVDMQLGVGFADQTLSGTYGRESESQWDKPYFDKGSSIKQFDHGGKTCGVQWQLEQNALLGDGIKAEVRLAVLVKRRNPMKDYRVRFQVVANSGSLAALVNKSRNALGISGGMTEWCGKPKPGDKGGCYDEGVEIVKYIDANNLGALVRDPLDSTNLNPEWFSAWGPLKVPSSKPKTDASLQADFNTPPLTSHATELSKSMEHGRDIGNEALTESDAMQAGVSTQPQSSAHAASGPASAMDRDSESIAIGSQPPQNTAIYSSLPPRMIDYSSYDRLVSLEGRMAQAEDRIFKLQQALARMGGTIF